MIEQEEVVNADSGMVLTSDVLRQLTDGVYIVDRDRRILFWNHAAEVITGFKAGDVVGSCCKDDILRHVDNEGCCLCENGCPLSAIMQDGQPRDMHVFLNHQQGHRVPVHVRGTPIYGSNNQVIGCVEVFSDDTQRLSMMDRMAKLENQAMIDPLTGLGNRRHFETTMSKAIERFNRNKQPFGLILIDIDHFKQVNDYYGHDVGDKLIQLVSRTMTGQCRVYDTASRWGGEEFALIIEQIDQTHLVEMANRLCHTINRSALEHNQCHITVSVSMGVTMIRPGDTTDSIFKRVDDLLFAAKDAGRNNVKVD